MFNNLSESEQIEALVKWMKFNLNESDYMKDGEYIATFAAETTIIECDYLDEDDDEIWETGPVWSAAIEFGEWITQEYDDL